MKGLNNGVAAANLLRRMLIPSAGGSYCLIWVPNGDQAVDLSNLSRPVEPDVIRDILNQLVRIVKLTEEETYYDCFFVLRSGREMTAAEVKQAIVAKRKKTGRSVKGTSTRNVRDALKTLDGLIELIDNDGGKKYIFKMPELTQILFEIVVELGFVDKNRN